MALIRHSAWQIDRSKVVRVQPAAQISALFVGIIRADEPVKGQYKKLCANLKDNTRENHIIVVR